METPLLHLISGNLREAHALGMITCEADALDAYLDLLGERWNTTANQEVEYTMRMKELKDEFRSDFRPIQAFTRRNGRIVSFCTVMPLSKFSKYWLDVVWPAQTFQEIDHIKTAVIRVAEKSSPVSDESLGQLKSAFERLNRTIKASYQKTGQKGVEIEQFDQFVEAAKRPFWVSRRVRKQENSAQHWRDRLGLIDYSEQTMLVRICLVASLADDPLPDMRITQQIVNGNPLWLYRPSMVHNGNRRFVQGSKADEYGKPASFGYTRDISTSDYLEAEKEMLLLAGNNAKVRLLGVDLLAGCAGKNAERDDDDQTFVHAIARQRGWELK